MILIGETIKIYRNTSLSATLYTTVLKHTVPGQNPILRNDSPPSEP